MYFSCLGICAFWLCCFWFPGSPAFWMWSLVYFIISTIYLPLSLSLLLYLSLSLISSLDLFISLSTIYYLSLYVSLCYALSLYISLCISRSLCLSPSLSFYLWIALSLFTLPLPVYFPLSWNVCKPTSLFRISRAHQHSECVSADSLTLVVNWCIIKIVNSQFMINKPVYYRQANPLRSEMWMQLLDALTRQYGTLWIQST